eukprot:TRINITY_DN5692_c0_g1_i1.p1 TRINITY_DN5692_c0_g1~~TRINITY_DN5692_c0_g1_i1.p1  ORF type:complete len:657 (+),score=156.86 TRINITY_DN5692_c0_g1_i1:65-2035(+)
MSLTPTLEVSVRIRPPHRRGVQHSVFGVGDEEGEGGEVGGGVVACKLFTNEHQPKFPFMFDKVFGPIVGGETIYKHSVRHIVHTGLGGGGGNVFVTGQACGQPYMTFTELLLIAAEEIIHHRPTAGYHLELSHIIVHNEIAMDHNHPKAAAPMSLSTARRVLVSTLPDITDVLPKDPPAGHCITTLFITDGIREGKICFVYLSSGGGKQNIALQILGKVFSGLATRKHVPYRESKVTSLLRSTLSPSTPMLHITCTATTPQDFYATLSGLKAAFRIRADNSPFTTGSLDIHYPQPRKPHPISRPVGNGVLAQSPVVGASVSPLLRFRALDVSLAASDHPRGSVVREARHRETSPVVSPEHPPVTISAKCSPIVAPVTMRYKSTGSPVEGSMLDRFFEEPRVQHVQQVVIEHHAEPQITNIEYESPDEKSEPSWSTLQRDIQLLASEVEALRGDKDRGAHGTVHNGQGPGSPVSPVSLPAVVNKDARANLNNSGVALDRLLKSQERETARLLQDHVYCDNVSDTLNEVHEVSRHADEHDEANPFIEMYKRTEECESQFLRRELQRVSGLLQRERKGKGYGYSSRDRECREHSCDSDASHMRGLIMGLAAATAEAQQNYIEKLEQENKSLRSLHFSTLAAPYPSHRYHTRSASGEKEV